MSRIAMLRCVQRGLGVCALATIGLMGSSVFAQTSAAKPWCSVEKVKFHPLTAEERTQGWVSLFDGSTVSAFRGFHSDMFPETGWELKQGSLRHVEGDGKGGRAGGDLLTRETFTNFEFAMDWCLEPGGNSGVKYLVDERHTKSPSKGAFGLEYQLIDDIAHSDAKQDNRKTAGIYDVAAPGPKKLNPAGQWNYLRIVVKDGNVEQWLNGEKVLAFQLGSSQFKAWVAGSKYKDDVRFGASRSGHIVLQEHGSGVAFRNIKVRRLP